LRGGLSHGVCELLRLGANPKESLDGALFLSKSTADVSWAMGLLANFKAILTTAPPHHPADADADTTPQLQLLVPAPHDAAAVVQAVAVPFGGGPDAFLAAVRYVRKTGESPLSVARGVGDEGASRTLVSWGAPP
jgi:hypothetical protein